MAKRRKRPSRKDRSETSPHDPPSPTSDAAESSEVRDPSNESTPKKRRRRRKTAARPPVSTDAESSPSPTTASSDDGDVPRKRKRPTRKKRTSTGKPANKKEAVGKAERPARKRRPAISAVEESAWWRSDEPPKKSPKRTSRSSSGRAKSSTEATSTGTTSTPTDSPASTESPSTAKPPSPKRSKSTRRAKPAKRTESSKPRPDAPVASNIATKDEDAVDPVSPVVRDRPEPTPAVIVAPTPDESTSKSPSTSGFAKLGLSDVMLESLTKATYENPTDIQRELIPLAMDGIDVMGQAQTGTGKTAAFGIPILERLKVGRGHLKPQALILTPTRELAVQVRDELSKLASGRPVHVAAVYGGKPIRQQTDRLQRGAQVVVGTPGRLLDHLGRGTLILADLHCVVLDEADRMLDIGFRPDIEKILRRCPIDRQTLLLSATIPPPVARLAKRYMRDPKQIDCSPTDIGVETIEQFYFTVDPQQKFDLLLHLIKREEPKQAIIFCRTRRGTDKIFQRLSKKVHSAAGIHGDMQQSARDRAMRSFRDGSVRFLVATDVVGRGIDVTNISHIINYDIPEFCDDYIHRVGRTGRMGREGIAFTFVSPEEGPQLTRIEVRINRLLKRDELSEISSSSQPKPAEEEVETKPVFGRPKRRQRRAL